MTTDYIINWLVYTYDTYVGVTLQVQKILQYGSSITPLQ